jgi:hypothetical protein
MLLFLAEELDLAVFDLASHFLVDLRGVSFVFGLDAAGLEVHGVVECLFLVHVLSELDLK